MIKEEDNLTELAEFKILLTEYKKLMRYLNDRTKLLDDKINNIDKRLDRLDGSIWSFVNSLNENLSDSITELNSKIEIVNLRCYSN